MKRFPRSLVAIFEQVAYSATNILVLALATRQLPSDEASAFALELLPLVILLVVGRGLVGTVLLIKLTTENSAILASGAIRRSMLIGMAGSGSTAFALFALGKTSTGVVLAISSAVLASTTNDAARHALLAAKRYDRALVASLLWLLIMLAVWSIPGPEHPQIHSLLAWIAGAYASLAYSLRCLGGLASPGQSDQVFQAAAAGLGRAVAIEQLLAALAPMALLLIVAGPLGATEVGHVRIAQSAIGPIAVAITGLSTFWTPRIAEAVRQGSVSRARRDSQQLAAVALSLAFVALIGYTVAGKRVGLEAFGAVWEPSHQLAFFVLANGVAISWRVGAIALMRAANAADGLRRLRVIDICLVFAFSLPAAFIGPLAFVTGTLTGSMISNLVWAKVFMQTRRRLSDITSP